MRHVRPIYIRAEQGVRTVVRDQLFMVFLRCELSDTVAERLDSEYS